MNFAALYKTYDAMCEPNYELKVGGKALGIGDDARLMWLECALEEKGGGEGSKNDAENKTVPLDEI